MKRCSTRSLIDDEKKEPRGLKCRDVCAYSNYPCSYFTIPLIFLAGAISTCFELLLSEWLREWVEQDNTEQTRPFYRLTFLLLLVFFFVSGNVRIFVINTVTLTQTKRLHSKMLSHLLRARVAFFDANPTGRILNRFSKDLAAGDMVLPLLLNWFIQISLKILGVLVIVVTVLPWMLIGVCLLFLTLFFLR